VCERAAPFFETERSMVHRLIALRHLGAVRVSGVVLGMLACVSGTAHAADSVWSTGVGKILPSDDTVWCA
jgi:hypothetical protein